MTLRDVFGNLAGDEYPIVDRSPHVRHRLIWDEVSQGYRWLPVVYGAHHYM